MDVSWRSWVSKKLNFMASSPLSSFVLLLPKVLITPLSSVLPLGKSPRTDVLLRAEQVVLELGAHTYWLSKETIDARPDHILNIIHYEDAASLAVAIMKKKAGGRIFLGCDNHPLSRQEVMDLMDQSGKYDKKFKGFTSTSGPLGKKLNNSRTRAEIG
uniref:NmrA-like domain-containing protein n=1 Tax=Brassica oleracea TaxID=3712 RepID=A0A3P6C3G4_BRAOL|nr:unnamed protein product [Brassica oleracea]